MSYAVVPCNCRVNDPNFGRRAVMCPEFAEGRNRKWRQRGSESDRESAAPLRLFSVFSARPVALLPFIANPYIRRVIRYSPGSLTSTVGPVADPDPFPPPPSDSFELPPSSYFRHRVYSPSSSSTANYVSSDCEHCGPAGRQDRHWTHALDVGSAAGVFSICSRGSLHPQLLT